MVAGLDLLDDALPSGAITVIAPLTKVATQMLPPASTPSESNIW